MVDMSLIICTYQTPIRNKEEGVRDKKAPAVLDLYNIMQDIGQHFRVYNIFGDYFNVLLPIDCAIHRTIQARITSLRCRWMLLVRA